MHSRDHPDLFTPRGAISDEAEVALDRTHQTISPRFTELRSAGYIQYLLDADGNRVRRATRSDNSAYVHIATEHGRQAAKLGVPIRIASTGDITSTRHRDNPMSNQAFGANDYATLRLDVLKYIVSQS
jgi:hypothetical protein